MPESFNCRRRRCNAVALWALAGAVLSATAPASRAAEAKVPEIKLSTAIAPSYPLGRAGERWAQLVNERAGGAFEVRQYSGATLALRDPGREFGALRDGLAELSVGSALAWSAQFPPLAAYATPWLTADAREQEALVADRDLREKVFALMEAAGVTGLAIAPLGEHVLATAKAAVEAPDDFAGLRVRVMPLRPMLEVFLSLGAQPQSMSFAEAQAAYVAGTLDGQDARPTTLVGTRAAASGQKFITRWGAFADVMVFAVRKVAWDAWTEDRRELVRSAALQAARESDALAREEAALAQLTREGVTIVRLSPPQRATLRDLAKSAIAAWTGAAGVELVEAARSAVAAAALKQ
ncbi:MAG TPA: TRAP transporter substrate-binding protein DctP [Casimicrobiaceae bacterium]|nr:TRAP transporter substrate-binding protein DctP [Casimicrobiaceae bacterium]